MVLSFCVFEMSGPSQQKRQALLLRAKKILVAHLMKFTSAIPTLIFKTSLKDLDVSSCGSKG